MVPNLWESVTQYALFSYSLRNSSFLLWLHCFYCLASPQHRMKMLYQSVLINNYNFITVAVLKSIIANNNNTGTSIQCPSSLEQADFLHFMS